MPLEEEEKTRLERLLSRLDGRGYKGYKFLQGKSFRVKFFTLTFTRIQEDPFAPPSMVEVLLKAEEHGFPRKFLEREAATPFSDFLARQLYEECKRHRRKMGTGNGGFLGVPKPSPCILQRSCVETCNGNIVARIYVGLPARGRRILGKAAGILLLETLPKVVEASLTRRHVDMASLERHVELFLDQEFLRGELKKRGLVAFIADGSILPRESSYSVRPMATAKPFRSPPSLSVVFRLPSGRIIAGMGVPEGVTVITGGGYHGKTTLLRAIQEGVYNHVEGDGREFVVTRRSAVKIRSEDGRIVRCVDISPFISELPSKVDTSTFTTEEASGTTSAAAWLCEALELGAEVILIDEDTIATNFLTQDDKMRILIKKEPVKPLSSLLREIYERLGVSFIIAAGSSSELLAAADTIILMEEYTPRDITEQAKQLVRKKVTGWLFSPPAARRLWKLPSIERVKIRNKMLVINRTVNLDLSSLEQLVEEQQLKTIAAALKWISSSCEGLTLKEVAERIDDALSEGFGKLFRRVVPPDCSYVRGFEVVFALNHLRMASMKIAL
ncbi:MAG: ABC-ATPase domain-containing protein [Candidatus Verstraetearchaeota archaeon]|nr:ABC-ATPase domain-containing protein [Candidatus Verstraetearchaeota archaeon]